jgi:transcriptional regulator with XRE-family HTH domain
MTIMSEVSWGKFIAERRKKLGLRQSDLASGLAYSNQAISKIENDETQLPLTLLSSLCNLLHLSLDDFFARSIAAPLATVPCPAIDSEIVASNITSCRNAHQLSLADEANYLAVSKSTLVLYEKGQSLPSLQGLLLLAKQAEVAPASFLQEPLLSPKAVTPLKNPKHHRWLWPVMVASILVIATAIIVPLSIKQYQNDHGIVSYEDQTFAGLDYCWLRSEDGQDKTAVLNAGTATAFSIQSDPADYFVGQEQRFGFAFTFGDMPLGVSFTQTTDYLHYSLALPSSSSGTTFKIIGNAYAVYDTSKRYPLVLSIITIL